MESRLWVFISASTAVEKFLRSLVIEHIYGYEYTLSLEDLKLLVNNIFIDVYED